MKTIINTVVVLLIVATNSSIAQEVKTSEKHGNTLNIGIGTGYYGYAANSLPLTINYEFDVAKDLTLAPFISIYSSRSNYYWGNPNKPYYDPSYRSYSYRSTYIPIGVKGTYYFDRLLEAGAKWDFYAAASLGFVYKRVVWENDYAGNRNLYNNYNPLYLDAHVGAEYHITNKAGIFLDLSTGVSSIGLALHL